MTLRKELFKVTNKLTNLIGYDLQLKQSDKDKEEQFIFFEYIRDNKLTYSQIYQDLFVQYILKNKLNGFFVEFGATNGVTLSNTLLLEKEYSWKGILAEPAKCWHDNLQKNRTSIIEKKCVWSKTGEIVTFEENNDEPELSTLNYFASTSNKSDANLKKYDVETISLNDLLCNYSAPHQIDYLSIDTEGSEYEILKNLDFITWDIGIITVEHNYQLEKRNLIHKLLSNHGYDRKFLQFSRWDDWYVKQN
jgi:FkbM family methyltransferase